MHSTRQIFNSILKHAKPFAKYVFDVTRSDLKKLEAEKILPALVFAEVLAAVEIGCDYLKYGADAKNEHDNASILNFFYHSALFLLKTGVMSQAFLFMNKLTSDTKDKKEDAEAINQESADLCVVLYAICLLYQAYMTPYITGINALFIHGSSMIKGIAGGLELYQAHHLMLQYKESLTDDESKKVSEVIATEKGINMTVDRSKPEDHTHKPVLRKTGP